VSTPVGAALDRDLTARRRHAWDVVMAGFVPGLATLEETVFTAAEAVRDAHPARVLDLGGGPGLFAERMARRWPAADVTLLDLDPVLLALARAAAPPRLAVRAADLASGDWPASAGEGHDLVTLVMTLHYLPPEQVRAVYGAVRALLAPGGLLVVADLMPDDGLPGLMAALNPAPGEAAAELAWSQWWDDVVNAPDLCKHARQREAVLRGRTPAEFAAGPAWHAATARAAGFSEAGLLWRCGRYAALAARV
jgi:SAM-dependent methyltransferase